MMKKLIPFIPWIVVVGLVVFAGATCSRLESVARNYILADANRRVALDTTRQHLVGENQGLSQLVEQQYIDIDDLGGLLGKSDDSVAALVVALQDRDVEHLAAVQVIQFAFDSVATENVKLNADINTLSRTGEAFRVVALDIEGPPISGDVDISIPADTTKPVDIEFVRLVVQPFNVTYTLGCAGHDAVVVIDAPAYISLELVPGVVSPDICNPLPTRQWFGDIFKLSPSNVVSAGVGILTALLLFR